MLAAKTFVGVGWNVFARLSGRAIDFTYLLVLARFLTPADFGLTAIALSMHSVIDMVLEVPLVQALTRLAVVEKSHLDTAFVLGLARGLIVFIAILLLSWPVASFYGDARLAPLLIFFSLGSVAKSVYSPAIVHFHRRLDFKVTFVTDFSGKLLAVVVSACVLLLGGTYWALACNTVLAAVVPTIISYFVAPYRPSYSLKNFTDFSAFAGWFTLSRMASAIAWQYDRVFLGYHVDKSVIGQYSMAVTLADMPNLALISPAMQPIMAAFASISNDLTRLRQAFLRASNFTMLVVAPAGVGLALVSDQIVSVILGNQWLGTALYLKWLALSSVFTTYYQPIYTLFLSQDRPIMAFRVSIIDSVLIVAFMTVGYYISGVPGMLVARFCAAAIQFVINSLFVRAILGLSVFAQIANLWKVAFSCTMMGISVMATAAALTSWGLGSLIELIVLGAVGAIIYIFCNFSLGYRFDVFGQIAR